MSHSKGVSLSWNSWCTINLILIHRLAVVRMSGKNTGCRKVLATGSEGEGEGASAFFYIFLFSTSLYFFFPFLFNMLCFCTPVWLLDVIKTRSRGGGRGHLLFSISSSFPPSVFVPFFFNMMCLDLLLSSYFNMDMEK